MANYEVIKRFVDLQDNNHLYEVGDVFPRQGKVVTDERLSELSGPDNKQHTPLIKEVVEDDANANTTPPVNDDAVPGAKKYTEEELSEMKVPQIREIAKELGFKIGSTSKEEIIAEFLEKQA